MDKPGKSVPRHLDTFIMVPHETGTSHTVRPLWMLFLTHPLCVDRARDFYHTCYCLSGLSVAQHFGNLESHHELILGREENRLVSAQMNARV